MKRLLIAVLLAATATLAACGDSKTEGSFNTTTTVTIIRTVENIDGSTTIYYSDGSVRTITGSFNNRSTAR